MRILSIIKNIALILGGNLAFNYKTYNWYILHFLGKDKTFSDNRKRKSGQDLKTKDKETNKQKKAPSSGLKKGEGGVIAKSLTMTKVSTPEKTTLGSQKKITKRKVNDTAGDAKSIPRKPGRPRSQSTASDVGKSKQRNAATSEKKNSIINENQSQNGKIAHEDTLDKSRGKHKNFCFEKYSYIYIYFYDRILSHAI